LTPGTYGIRELTPDNLIDGGASAGRIDGRPAGTVAGSSSVLQIELRSGEQALDVDFCEHLPSSLSGFVYHDVNNDGIRATSETGIAGTIVRLLDDAGNEVDRRLTDASGAYRFDRLEAGNYTLVEQQPDGWNDGLDSAGQVDGVRRGIADSAADRISQINMGWGEDGEEYNFGELLWASIEGIVHTDLDKDCELDADEVPLAGVLIELLDRNGNIVGSQRTDSNGTFRFERLDPGSYTVREHQPLGFFQGGQRAGSGGGNTDVIDTISAIEVRSGDRLVDYRFCEVPPSEISGYVFQDGPTVVLEEDETLPEDLSTIRDGQRTDDDRMLSGVQLELRDGVNGAPILGSAALPGSGYAADQPIRVTTNANGFYRFVGLPAGNYAIYQVQPDGFVDGIDTGGSVPAIAINRHDYDDVTAQMVSELEVNPNFDAIIRLALFANVTAIENNFSEIAVTDRTLRVPMPEPGITPSTPLPPIQWLAPALSPGPDLPLLDYQLTGFGRVRGVTQSTWHLSVLSGGWPRGAGLPVPTRGPFWQESAEEYYVAWEDPRGEQLYWMMLVDGQLNRERLFGNSDGVPIAGDFNGDGMTEIGVFYQGQWFIDINGNGRWDPADLWAKLGHEGDQPVVGDWDGDGKDDIGVFGLAWPGDPRAIARDPGLPDRMNDRGGEEKNAAPPVAEAAQGSRAIRMTDRSSPRSDLIDHVFHYGTTGDQAVAGDWNGDGISNIGVFHKGVWHLDQNGDGIFERDKDLEVVFGAEGDVPIVGDFNGDGVDEIGIVSGGRLVLDTNRNYRIDEADQVIPLPHVEGRPVVGDWNGDGIDDVGFTAKEIRFVEIDARR
jgi:protocatechuate 3,4-dioxygenase beta subunit